MDHKIIPSLPISHPSQEKALQASKWMYIRMLLDPEELIDLFSKITPAFLLNISTVCRYNSIMTSTQELIDVYTQYIQSLQEGRGYQDYTKALSWALSSTLDPFYLMQLQEERFLVKLKKPVIRMQHFHFHYIFEQHSFILTHHAEHSIAWGLEFSFPQFYQDAHTCLPVEVFKNHHYPNTQVFKMMQKWVRDYTVPVPFIMDGNKKVAPFRLGKKCFKWIHLYPDLRKRGLAVYAHRNHHDWT